jgi:hypothetical protein
MRLRQCRCVGGLIHSSRDGQKLLVARQRCQVQLLPNAAFLVCPAATSKSGPLSSHANGGQVNCGNGLHLICTAQTRQAVYQDRAVRALLGVEGQQLGLFTRCISGQGRAQAQKSREINHAMQATTQVGHTNEPSLRVRHRQQGAQWKQLTRSVQRHQNAQAGTFHSQPGLRTGFRARLLQACSKAALQITQGFAVGHQNLSAVSRKT